MTKVCFICEKSVVKGGNRKHRRGSSGGGGSWRFKSQRTIRTWKPNFRKITIREDGRVSRELICMKCYKKLRNDEKEMFIPAVPIVTAEATFPTAKASK